MAVKKEKTGGKSPVKKKSTKTKKSSVRQKKAGKKRATKKKAASDPSIVLEMKKVITGLTVLFVFIAMVAMVADFYLKERRLGKTGSAGKMESESRGQTGNQEPTAVEKKIVNHKTPLPGLREKRDADTGDPMVVRNSEGHGTAEDTVSAPDVSVKKDEQMFEVFDRTHSPPAHRTPSTAGHGADGLPRISIIIDDVGYDADKAMAFAALDDQITLSILPGLPFSRVIATRLHAENMEVMLHLPMEPLQYPEVNPGRGALMAAMTPDELITTLRRNLDNVPYADGVNNHMGSRLTSLSDQMRQVFTVLKKRRLFFIDSLTARGSACRASAALFQLPFAQRDVFLDNIQDKAYITGQLQELVRISRRHGSAIGIGHPYPATLQALKAVLPHLRKEVRIVKASQLVVPSG